jgi:hypothetical protein
MALRMLGVTRYLHTMYRITDPEKSRAFYEALGLQFRPCPARRRSWS